ncbi:MAG: acyl-CoA synthetase [Variovorax paradoxus]|nr:MAG: acyl-CoA synthetase [Variovorax paradoxus]PZQ14570.1 MAG: acyl-CoA synthetase [Variovorax paradoxus]
MHTELTQLGSLGDLIVTALQRGGDRTAFIHGERRTSYREFGAQLARLIAALDAQGLKKGDTIASLSGNRPEAFLVSCAGYLMGLRVGWINPTASENDQAYLLTDAGVGTLFIDPDLFRERGERLAARTGIQRVWWLAPTDAGTDIDTLCRDATPAPLLPRASADDVAVLVYTGGTTGVPKGVIHTHRVQVAMTLMQLADWDWPQETRYLALTPITHAAGTFILPTLLRGGTVVLTHGFSADKFIDLVERHRITTTFLVPTMLYVLLDHARLASADLASLQMVAYGAAPMLPSRLIEGMRRLGPVFMQLYGQSEAPMMITVLRQRDHDPEHHPERLASCGLPVIGNQLRLLDEQGREVPQGEVGEICLRSPLVMAGYLHKPEETAKALRHGWLYTGDLARQDADGFLYIVDRSKDMVISGGFNVYPREVEDVLALHPAVSSAAVVGVPDPKWGEQVRAMVVLRQGQSATAEELMALVREHKGAVSVPKQIRFVEQLPVTTIGKLDKKAVRARFAQEG